MTRRAADVLRIVAAGALLLIAALVVLLAAPFALTGAGIGCVAAVLSRLALAIIPSVGPAESDTGIPTSESEADDAEPIEPSAFWALWGIRRTANL